MPQPGGYLLDTNIIVALVRLNPFGRRIAATYGIGGGSQRYVLSAVSVGELNALALKFHWGDAKRARLAAILNDMTIVDINDSDLLQAYGDIDYFSESNGYRMGQNDVWIAATARALDATLLTSDKDFDHLHGHWIVRELLDPAAP